MTKIQEARMLRNNSTYWITAMVLPALMHFAFEAFASNSAPFPWVVILPPLYIGLLTRSNALLSMAIGEPTEDSSRQ